MLARVAIAVPCLACFFASAEQPVARLFTTADGLVRNYVNSIRRDSRGRLWFCTIEGLSLFDGNRFANYTTEDGLPHRLVFDIAEAGDGTYWLATKSGLFRFRPRAVRLPEFQSVALEGGAGALGASRLLRTRAGAVWWGTNRGLYRLEEGSHPRAVLVPVRAQPSSPEPLISGLVEGPDGSIWMAADAAAIIRRAPDGRLEKWPSSTGPKGLIIDREGVLWAVGWGGVHGLDLNRTPPSSRVYRVPPAHRLFDAHAIFQAVHWEAFELDIRQGPLAQEKKSVAERRLQLLSVPGFLDYAGPTDHSRYTATGRIAFPVGNRVQRPNQRFSKLNRPAHRYPCLRFDCHLTATSARLGAKMDSLSPFS